MVGLGQIRPGSALLADPGLRVAVDEPRRFNRNARIKLRLGASVLLLLGLVGLSTIWTSNEPTRVLTALGGGCFIVVAVALLVGARKIP